MQNKLKELIKQQLITTEIPSYFEWNNKRIFYTEGRWVVYDAYGRLYDGYNFNSALEIFLA